MPLELRMLLLLLLLLLLLQGPHAPWVDTAATARCSVWVEPGAAGAVAAQSSVTL
jgi:hypothetical protein